MKISKRQLRRIIREEKRRVLKEAEGFIENAELKEAVYRTFLEWCAEDGDYSLFEEGVARRYSELYGETVDVMGLQLACQDIIDGVGDGK